MKQSEQEIVNAVAGDQQLYGSTHRQRGVFETEVKETNSSADPLGTVNASIGRRGQLSRDEIEAQIEEFGGEMKSTIPVKAAIARIRRTTSPRTSPAQGVPADIFQTKPDILKRETPEVRPGNGARS